MDKLTVILPAFNESKSLPIIVNDISTYLSNSKLFTSVQTIIVNDFSTDNTKEVVKKLVLTEKNIILINLNQNIGKAYAIDVALEQSTDDLIVIMDADMQYEIKDILDMKKLMKSNFRKGQKITMSQFEKVLFTTFSKKIWQDVWTL